MRCRCGETNEVECLAVDPRFKPWDDGVCVGVLAKPTDGAACASACRSSITAAEPRPHRAGESCVSRHHLSSVIPGLYIKPWDDGVLGGVLTTRTAGAGRAPLHRAGGADGSGTISPPSEAPSHAGEACAPGTTSPPSSQGLTLGSTAEHGGQAGATASPCARHDWHHRSGKASIAWRHRPAPRRFRAGDVAYSGTAALA
ncbi:hypothetical protein GA0061105_108262 [Rhizobium aethiopicum]|uniref:Uncharacterized protein n=1 Tax=Rhizobium aethiopicum TaxID=1138170 RepID=A0A1C3Y604_9HYPH|nr:hypothetical protein GA0061105_108262 [Rhizobium aethiopicum]